MVIELTGMEIANSYWMKVPLLLKQWLLDVKLRSKENTILSPKKYYHKLYLFCTFHTN
jgi:hypothetical protein